MSLIRRIAKLGALVALGLAATGCIVLPYGGGHRHGRGGGYYADNDGARSAPVSPSRGDPRRDPR